MKTKMSTILVLILLFTCSCDFFDDPIDTIEKKSFVADISATSDFDYLVFSETDESFLAVDQENGLPVRAMFKPSVQSEAYSIWFDCNGYPEKIVKDGYIVLLSNYTATSFDLAIVSPEGEISVIREVNIPADKLEYSKLKSVDPSDVLRWTSHIMGVVSCGASLIGGTAATVASLGVSAPVAAVLIGLGCGSTALSIATEFISDEQIADITGMSAKELENFLTVIHCTVGDLTTCIESSLGIFMATAADIVEYHEEEIKLAQGSLEGGYGDIQVTLSWDSSADIDLYVQDPMGEWIWYKHKNSQSGGWLDVDDRDGFGPENIFWGKNVSPTGNYQVYVKHFEGGSANFSVLVQAYGRTKQYKGFISPGGKTYITEFSKTFLKSGKIQPDGIELPSLRKN
ncbi:MAG: hypothetical protein Q8R96_10890 [Bacteroidota bacterium]|nr:hypothetical protein [Bacteroidota bacterium]